MIISHGYFIYDDGINKPTIAKICEQDDFKSERIALHCQDCPFFPTDICSKVNAICNINVKIQKLTEPEYRKFKFQNY